MIKNIDEILVGSIISQDIVKDGVLLIKKGVPFNEHLRYTLPKFGIDKIDMESIVDDRIDKRITDFEHLNHMVYPMLKSLDINSIVLCAKSLVNSVIESSDNKLLRVIYDYDASTYDHSVNVANLAVAVGIELKCTIKQLQYLTLGGLLHDIGKSSIPIDIINKPGKLTDEEYEIVKQHPTIGYNMIKDNPELSSAVKQIVYQHHENYDGTGYPNKLRSLNSYRFARLVHICDVYEALCAVRSYKDAIPRRTVRKIMQDGSNTLFDASLLKVFLNTVPMYMVGEIIQSEGRVGLVMDSVDKMNPDIFYKGITLKLTEFEKLIDLDLDLLSQVH